MTDAQHEDVTEGPYQSPEAQAWRDLQRRRRALVVCSLAGFVVVLGGLGVLSLVRGEDLLHALGAVPDGVLIGVLLTWVLAVGVASGHLLGFRCPRCAKPFHVQGTRKRPYAHACLHCGVRVGAASPARAGRRPLRR